MATCVLISKDVELSPSTVLKIKSPGYQDVNFKNDTVLTWNVTAPASTEEILIDIDMDLTVKPPSGICEDYLKEINHPVETLLYSTDAVNLRQTEKLRGIVFLSNSFQTLMC